MNDNEFEHRAKFLRNGIFSGLAVNASMPGNDKPITIDDLIKMKEELDRKFPPLPYEDGADMSLATYYALLDKGDFVIVEDSDKIPFASIDVHFRNDVPYGEIRECTCGESAE